MIATEVTSGTQALVQSILHRYSAQPDQVPRYVGQVGGLFVVASQEPDRTGCYYEVIDLWRETRPFPNEASKPERIVRVTGAEGRALAEMLKRPG